MRISESSQAEELNFLNMTTSHDHHSILSKKKIQSSSSSSSYCANERTRYIHRCPFSHCPHQNNQHHHHDLLNNSNHDENKSLGVKISLDTFNHSNSPSSSCSPTSTTTLENWTSLKKSDGLRQGRFIARGATKPFITSQDRQKAISYMLERMKIKKNLNKNIQNRIVASLLALEKQVYLDSHTKEKYTENLAIKLFLISQELEKRKSVTSRRGESMYTDITLRDSGSFNE